MSKAKEIFEEFCIKNNIVVEFHRKKQTKGCVEAIKERSHALGYEILLGSELKTLFLVTQGGKFIALHMSGDSRLIATPFTTDYCRSYRESCSRFGYISHKLGLQDDPIVGMANAVSGTLNPISLYINSLCIKDYEVRQVFDSSLPLDSVYYTNAGDRVWGVKISNLREVLDAVPHTFASVAKKTLAHHR